MNCKRNNLPRYPPAQSVASRCGQKPICSEDICPNCPITRPTSRPRCPGESSVRFQLTYTCNRYSINHFFQFKLFINLDKIKYL